MVPSRRMSPGRHILVLADRDWTHPQAGGTGTVLRAQVLRWIDAGHRVTVIAGAYDGAERVSRPHERLQIHPMGTRLTVVPRGGDAAAGVPARGVGDAARRRARRRRRARGRQRDRVLHDAVALAAQA